jgi:glycerophosphoryl diester phosphodiesterase
MALTPRLEAVIAERGYLRSAHRGAPSFGTDNTDRAILAALEHAPDLVEVDVHRTVDDGLILWHDAHIEISNQRLTLAQTKLEHLRALRLEDGSRLLSLEEALEVTAGRAGLLIDLKAPNLETLILSALERCRAEDAVVCGDYTETLRAVQAAGVPASYTPDPWKARLLGERLEWDALTVHHRTVTPNLLERANAGAVRVIAWTVDDPGRMRELIDQGIHGITTNRIEILERLEPA